MKQYTKPSFSKVNFGVEDFLMASNLNVQNQSFQDLIDNNLGSSDKNIIEKNFTDLYH